MDMFQDACAKRSAQVRQEQEIAGAFGNRRIQNMHGGAALKPTAKMSFGQSHREQSCPEPLPRTMVIVAAPNRRAYLLRGHSGQVVHFESAAKLLVDSMHPFLLPFAEAFVSLFGGLHKRRICN